MTPLLRRPYFQNVTVLPQGALFLNTCKGYICEMVDKIMKTLTNFRIEFVLAKLKVLQLATMNVLLPFVYTLVTVN
jgi:hypothetical protein